LDCFFAPQAGQKNNPKVFSDRSADSLIDTHALCSWTVLRSVLRPEGRASRWHRTPTVTDGLAHLSLITCARNLAIGEIDHHTVVYATLKK